MPAARELTRRPGERPYSTTLVKNGLETGLPLAGTPKISGGSMQEGNVRSGAPYSTEIRWLFQAGLLVFVVTVST